MVTTVSTNAKQVNRPKNSIPQTQSGLVSYHSSSLNGHSSESIPASSNIKTDMHLSSSSLNLGNSTNTGSGSTTHVPSKGGHSKGSFIDGPSSISYLNKGLNTRSNPLSNVKEFGHTTLFSAPLKESDSVRDDTSETSSYCSSDVDDLSEKMLWDCPLCMEEVDKQDIHFTPCECGYQICRFCWHHIKSVLNDKCPACRRSYTDQEEKMVSHPSLEAAEKQRERKQKESKPRSDVDVESKVSALQKRNKPGIQAMPATGNLASSTRGGAPLGNVLSSRKHLIDLRVLQPNLVYVIGIPLSLHCYTAHGSNTPNFIPSSATQSPSATVAALEVLLATTEYFGKYGNIVKLVINLKGQHLSKPTKPPPSSSINTAAAKDMEATTTVSAFLTYEKKEEASKAIECIDGTFMGGFPLRATYGTTKYCAFFLRGQTCPNATYCLYLHEFGEDQNSYTKEALAIRQRDSQLKKTLSNGTELITHTLSRKPTPLASSPAAAATALPFTSSSTMDEVTQAQNISALDTSKVHTMKPTKVDSGEPNESVSSASIVEMPFPNLHICPSVFPAHPSVQACPKYPHSQKLVGSATAVVGSNTLLTHHSESATTSSSSKLAFNPLDPSNGFDLVFHQELKKPSSPFTGLENTSSHGSNPMPLSHATTTRESSRFFFAKSSTISDPNESFITKPRPSDSSNAVDYFKTIFPNVRVSVESPSSGNMVYPPPGLPHSMVDKSSSYPLVSSEPPSIARHTNFVHGSNSNGGPLDAGFVDGFIQGTRLCDPFHSYKQSLQSQMPSSFSSLSPKSKPFIPVSVSVPYSAPEISLSKPRSQTISSNLIRPPSAILASKTSSISRNKPALAGTKHNPTTTTTSTTLSSSSNNNNNATYSKRYLNKENASLSYSRS